MDSTSGVVGNSSSSFDRITACEQNTHTKTTRNGETEVEDETSRQGAALRAGYHETRLCLWRRAASIPCPNYTECAKPSVTSGVIK